MKKVVLAYSGGLDTSYCVKYLSEEMGLEVYTALANTGGFTPGELAGIEEKAYALGAKKHVTLDVTGEYYEKCIKYMIFGNVLRNKTYPVSVSSERTFQALAIVRYAKEIGADGLAHGSTGAGNDQVRFELTIKALAPHMKIIAPWRIWDMKSREDEMAYAEAHGVPIDKYDEKQTDEEKAAQKYPYSMDWNMWHLSHEGDDLENPANAPHKDMYLVTCDPEEAPDKPEIVTIDFEKGIPTAVNGKKMDGVELVNTLNAIGARNGIGIDDLVENRLVGMKSRGVYENPCGSILFYAHTELERLCLDRATFHFKEIAAVKYSELVYDGMWFAPLREALQAFADKTSETVTGKVTLRLYKGNIMSNGAESPYSLYNEEFVTFGEDDVYNQADAEGFINLFGLPLTIRALMKEKNAK